MFFATGGQHLNSGDFFRAARMKENQEKIKPMEDEKKQIFEDYKIQEAAAALIKKNKCKLLHAHAKK